MNTITTMAKTLGVDRNAIQYIIKSRSITPAGKVGSTNVYSLESFDQIKKIVKNRRVAL